MMLVLRSIAAGMLAVVIGASSVLAEAAQIGWDDLVPAAESYENPFEDLATEQMRDLRTVLRNQTATGENLTAQSQSDAEAARLRLKDQGLDIEWLFKQREMIIEKRRSAAIATRSEIIGQDVRIPGYLLPLDLSEGRAVEFLLVPTVGACIHTPPPPANQMIHVRYPDGIEIKGLYEPIWIRGTLASNFSEQTVRYSDGVTRIEVSYAMTADLVEPYQ